MDFSRNYYTVLKPAIAALRVEHHSGNKTTWAVQLFFVPADRDFENIDPHLFGFDHVDGVDTGYFLWITGLRSKDLLNFQRFRSVVLDRGILLSDITQQKWEFLIMEQMMMDTEARIKKNVAA
jgi:hypothetical protein